MLTTAVYDFSALVAAREQLLRALDSYESACENLDLFNLPQSALPESALQTFFSTVEHERDVLARQTSRTLLLSAKLDEILNRSIKMVPFGRLLPEILSTIFIMAANSTRATLAQARRRIDKPVEFANVISSVCSHWRRVALDTPALWAHIDLNRKGGLNHAALWLDRARSYPLQITSYSADREGSDQEWISLLEPHSHRFNSLILDINFVGREIFRSTCARHTTTPLCLQFLALSFASTPEANQLRIEDMDGLLETHSIHLQHISLGSFSSAAFQGLRHLYLGCLSEDLGPSLEQIMQVLRANPDLRYLELSKMGFRVAPEPDIPPVKLEKLETLRFRLFQSWHVKWLLNHLVLRPEGVTLVLSGYSDSNEARVGLGLQILSNHCITALCFLSPLDGPNYLDFDALLSELPRLETLALENISLHVAKRITPSHRQSPALPNLSLISCEMYDIDSFMAVVVRHSVRRMRVFDSEADLTREFVLDRAPNIEFSEEPGSSVPLTWRPFG